MRWLCVSGGGGRTHLLLALVIWPLTTHPFRGGASFIPLIETLPTFRSSLRFFRLLRRKYLLIFSPSCFAVCGHHLSHRIAIVFSLLSSVPNFSMSHSSIFVIPPPTHPVPPCVFHLLPLCEFYSLLPSVPNFSMSHSSIFLISPWWNNALSTSCCFLADDIDCK